MKGIERVKRRYEVVSFRVLENVWVELYSLTASKVEDEFSLLGRLTQKSQDRLLNDIHSKPITSVDQG